MYICQFAALVKGVDFADVIRHDGLMDVGSPVAFCTLVSSFLHHMACMRVLPHLLAVVCGTRLESI
jgi:hypothetical protein